MLNSLAPYLLSFRVRILLLRIIVISSFSSFAINVIYGAQLFINYGDFLTGSILIGISMIPVSVSLHHIFRLWPRKRWSVRSDFIFSAVESCIVTAYLIGEIILVATNDAFAIVICSFASVFLWLSVVASFVLTIWKLRTSQSRVTGSIYDFMENYDGVSIGWKRSKRGLWSLAFGENIVRRRFGIDRVFVRGLRAAVSVLCLLGMITLGYLVLVVQPMQQQLHFQRMQTTDPSEYGYANVTLEMSLVVETWNTGYTLLPRFFDFDVMWLPESKQVLCHSIPRAKVICNVHSPFSSSSPDNLIIKINYTRALQQFPISSLRTGVYLRFRSPTQDSAASTLPIQLYPGFHLFGTTFYSFQDTYASPKDLSFGVPHFNRYLVANVQALVQDPEFPISTSDNTTATLRLTYQGALQSVQADYEVQRQQPSDTVLSGFALLGGVWTFINGLFSMIFGCKLLLVLFGIKPLSIYGLIHLFQGRRSLVDGGYTLSAEEQSRTIALLREHLLDDDNGNVESGEAGDGRNRDEERMQLHEIA